MQSLLITISGRVQKVGYLYYIKQRADNLGIKGSASYNGTQGVKIQATGHQQDMDNFLLYCRLGTSLSKIENLTASEVPADNADTFEIQLIT